jgi:hypothetical protein
MEQNTGFKEMFLRLVAIVGLIAVLILGAWGIILLAFNLVGLFTGSVHLSNLFNHNETPAQVATTTPTTPVVVVPSTNTSGGNTSNNTGGSTSGATSVYVPAAKPVATLYGLPDLAVTLKSVTSLSSVQGRTVVQFSVSNVGTNTARSGWTFNATLPYQNSTYTYRSQPQMALNPGDSIAFTLTYDDPMYNQYNPYNTYPYSQYNTQYNYNYVEPQTCYTYNGYQNVAGPCPITYDNNGNPIYPNNQYSYNQYPYNPNYNYNYPNYQSRVVSVTVDPLNYVPEGNEYNNTATKGY